MTARPALGRAEGDGTGHVGDRSFADALGAAAERRWLDAYEALRALDRASALSTDALELLATAAFLCGYADDSRQARLRAYHLHVGAGEVRGAARCAVQVGLERLDAGEIAEARGCLPLSVGACSAWAAQATGLLEGVATCAEHGYPLIALAHEHLTAGNDGAAGRAAAEAVALGRRFVEPGLLALALVLQGRALIRSGDLPAGLAAVDEAVTVVAVGDVPAPTAGLVLTTAVDACDEAQALERLDEHRRALMTWVDAQHGMVTFRARALLHEARAHRRRGRWDAALAVAEGAGGGVAGEHDRAAAAAARYEQAEIHRLRGDLRTAADAYASVGAMGLDPQPGLALLRAAEGDPGAGAAALQRALGERRSRSERSRLLAALVEVLVALGNRARAADAVTALEAIAAGHPAPALHATAQHARGCLLLADEQAEAALVLARDAARTWSHLGFVHETARARVLVARSCRLLGDDDTAVLELEAACATFAALGARPELERARGLVGRPSGAPFGLTPREREVLRLLATGLTNQAIAQRLHVTTRTVDTHVSRILTKLGVPTRTAAAALAHEHRLT